ncbi:hypothetical protein D9M72_563530 [compost metagenome]
MPEHEVLVVLDAALAVEVDVEEFPGPQRLGDAMGEIQPGHLLVPGFRVEAHDVAVFQLCDEGQSVADGGQEDVAAGLVGFWFQGDPKAVALVLDIGRGRVHAFLHPVQGGREVLGTVILAAFAPAPHDEGLCTQLCCKVDVLKDFAEREPAD